MSSLSIGAWIDGPQPSSDGVEAWAAQIAETGIQCATIVLNVGLEPYHMPRWSAEKLGQATRALHNLGLDVWWSMWAVATDMAIDEQVLALESLLVESTPDGVEFDAEGKYNDAGWGPHGESAALYMGELLGHLQALPPRLAVTAIPTATGIRAQDRALIESLSHVRPVEGRPQAYSQFQENKLWTHGPLMRPGRTQHHTLAQWLPLIGEGLLSNVRCGLMAGFQGFPPPSPRGNDALRISLDTVREYDLHEVCYWSWKLIKGRRDITGFLQRMSGAGGVASL